MFAVFSEHQNKQGYKYSSLLNPLMLIIKYFDYHVYKFK